jgi:hypothetical protein
MKYYQVVFMMLLFFCGTISFGQISGTSSSFDAKIQEWKKILIQFETAAGRKDEAKMEEVAKTIFACDTDKMPPEWRHAFIEEQLWICHHTGNWKQMEVIKNRLMGKKRARKKDDLLDADLLLCISGYYGGMPYFPPPKELQKHDNEAETSKFALEYFKKNYKDDKEHERILQYIVDNFDPNYGPVHRAERHLASLRVNMGKPVESMLGYQALETQDLKKLYCLPQVDLNNGNLLSAEMVLNQLFPPEYLKKEKSEIHQEMLRVSNFLEVSANVDKAIEELRALRKKHLDNPELRTKIEIRLRELSLKSDLIIPAEELGLPQVTTNTLTTSGTLSASPKK